MKKNRVADRRIDLRLTKAQLSRDAGVSRQAISRIEDGGDTGVYTAIKIASALRTSVECLFGDEGEKPAHMNGADCPHEHGQRAHMSRGNLPTCVWAARPREIGQYAHASGAVLTISVHIGAPNEGGLDDEEPSG